MLVKDSSGWYLTELSHYEAVIDVIGSVGIDDDFISPLFRGQLGTLGGNSPWGGDFFPPFKL